ncbi:MAG TPA: DUF4126 family protein [Terriglobales bacterium]|jgi:uncharacterized membrane protein|nr:DUF4126 family protein [Terriglobales bacterium]
MDPKILALCILMGAVTGLRTMTGLAVISWWAHLGWIDLKDSRPALIGSTVAVVLLTLGALGEYVGDKLPRTPNRTAPGPLLARLIAGGICGALLCIASDQSWHFGLAFGAVGAIIGSFAGYYARTTLVRAMRSADIFVAIPEDLLAIGLAVLVMACL